MSNARYVNKGSPLCCYNSLHSFPGVHQTQISLLDCQMVKCDYHSRERISTAPEFNGGELYTTPADAWDCAW